MALSRILRVPKPKSFLHLMSLRTATTITISCLLINKVSGLYGILALLTGLRLNTLQFSSYIYSILALGIAAYLFPHIRRQSPLQCVALAWFYLLDSVINAGYTAAFAIAWFTVLSQHSSAGSGVAGTINDTAGFTDPQYTVTSVEIAAPTAVPGSSGATSTGSKPAAHLIGHAGDATSTTPDTYGAAFLQSGSMASITVISLLWLLRLYSILIVMSYARSVLRRYIVQSTQSASAPLVSSSSEAGYAENPFEEGKELGSGWSGRLGRVMLSMGKSYWLGADEDGGFGIERSWSGFDAAGVAEKGSGSGRREVAALALVERERRRRAGTDPPLPLLKSIELGK